QLACGADPGQPGTDDQNVEMLCSHGWKPRIPWVTESSRTEAPTEGLIHPGRGGLPTCIPARKHQVVDARWSEASRPVGVEETSTGRDEWRVGWSGGGGFDDVGCCLVGVVCVGVSGVDGLVDVGEGVGGAVPWVGWFGWGGGG